MPSVLVSRLSFDAFRTELARPDAADPWFIALQRASTVIAGAAAVQSLSAFDETVKYGGEWAIWT